MTIYFRKSGINGSEQVRKKELSSSEITGERSRTRVNRMGCAIITLKSGNVH